MQKESKQHEVRSQAVLKKRALPHFAMQEKGSCLPNLGDQEYAIRLIGGDIMNNCWIMQVTAAGAAQCKGNDRTPYRRILRLQQTLLILVLACTPHSGLLRFSGCPLLCCFYVTVCTTNFSIESLNGIMGRSSLQ